MAVKYELIITIDPDGKVKLKTIGFKGSECDDELKPFEATLGKPIEKKRTREYYEKSKNAKSKVRSKTK
jgi:hypothetical protein